MMPDQGRWESMSPPRPEGQGSAISPSSSARSEPRTGNSIQDISSDGTQPSKYKLITPTKLADLVKHQPDKYRPLKAVFTDGSTLADNLVEGYFVKLAWINRHEVEVQVHRSNPEEEQVSGRITGIFPLGRGRPEGIQMSQRVRFSRYCIFKVHDGDSED